MAEITLDDVDRTILHALQEDARTTTAEEIGERAGVSATTVRNRLKRLEETDVIRGYYPHVDYERAGYQLHLFIVCRAPPAKRAALAEDALGVAGIVTVREMLSGTNNLHVEVIAEDSDAVDEIAARMADLGLEIVRTDVVKNEHVQPFNHFDSVPSTAEDDA